MRLILLTCAVCLLALAFGCKRSGQQSTNNSAGSAQVSNSLPEDRTRAREQLDKGKELYRTDQDGTVTVETDGARIQVTTANGKREILQAR